MKKYVILGLLLTISNQEVIAQTTRLIVPTDAGIQVPFGAVGDVLVAGPATSQIQDSGGLSGGVANLPSALLAQKSSSTPPSSICSTGSYASGFSCDLSKLNYAVGNNITGATTLGQPTTGYLVNPNMSSIYVYFSNASGFNNSTSSNSGRTNGSAIYVKADALGQGDTTVLFGNVFVNSARAGATSFLANPAGGIIGGQVLAGQAGVYLEPLGDMNCNDQGFDVACIGGVFNLNRSVSTGALGATWLGLRVQSQGSASIDAAFSASGNINVGYDISNATLGTNQAAIALSANQRIYGNVTGGTFFPSALSNSYLVYSSGASGWQVTTAGVTNLTVTNSYVGVVNPSAVNSGDRFGVVGSASTQLGMTLDNSNSGTTATTVFSIGNNTSASEVQFALNGGGFSGGLGANAFAIKLGGTSMITMVGTTVGIPNVATGTPVASLCIDSSNNIIKKTTAGSCI